MFIYFNICIFVLTMYKEDSFNIVAPLELGPFWGDAQSEDFFVTSKYSGIWDSTILTLFPFSKKPRFPRFIDKC